MDDTSTYSVFAATNTSTISVITQQIMAMQEAIMQLTTKLEIQEWGGRTGCHQPPPSEDPPPTPPDPGGPSPSGPPQCCPQQYCWTHGSCAHFSAQCHTPAQGDQTTATYHNQQNGSNKNCSS